MTRNLRPLERDGLIKVSACPSDARAREIQLTEPGTQKYEEALVLWRDAQKKVVALYGEDNWRALEGQLRQLRSLVSEPG